MKTLILSLVGVAVLLATISTQAQNGAPAVGYAVISLPATYAAGTTNIPLTIAPQIGALKQQNLALASTISAASPGATNIYTFAKSVDGINFDTNAADVVSFQSACIGAGPVTTVTNLPTGGVTYFKLITVVTTGTATNNSFLYGVKISAP